MTILNVQTKTHENRRSGARQFFYSENTKFLSIVYAQKADQLKNSCQNVSYHKIFKIPIFSNTIGFCLLLIATEWCSDRLKQRRVITTYHNNPNSFLTVYMFDTFWNILFSVDSYPVQSVLYKLYLPYLPIPPAVT